MASLDSVLYRNAAAKGRVIFVGDDTNHLATPSVAIRLRYVGTGTVTSVTITTATSLVNVTSDGETDTYLFSGYATIGALVDAINADGIFEARVLDGLRADATASQFTDGAITSSTSLEGFPIWDVTVDNDAALYMTACLDPKDRGFLSPKDNRVRLFGYEYSINMGTAAADSEQVWVRDGATERQIIGRKSVNTTLTTRNFASGNSSLLGDPGQEIIVKVVDAGTLSDDAGNYIQVDGEIV